MFSLCYKQGAVGIGMGMADTAHSVPHSIPPSWLEEPQFPPGVSVISPKMSYWYKSIMTICTSLPLIGIGVGT